MLAAVFVIVILRSAVADDDAVPEYVQQCRYGDKELLKCLTNAVHHLRPYLAKGIPEIDMPSIEPFRTDQLALSLSSGPNGYKIVLRDIEIYGASNYTVNKIRLGTEDTPFEAKLYIPKLHITARYTSSGILIILPASGNGAFFADFQDVNVTVRGIGVKHHGDPGKSVFTKKDDDFLQIQELSVDLDIKKVHMTVKKIFNNNRILTEATNLFLSENGHEVLRHMMPQLRVKIASLIVGVANKLLMNVPTRFFIV